MNQQLTLSEQGLFVVGIDDSARDTVLLLETEGAALDARLREVRVSLRIKNRVAIPVAAWVVRRRRAGGRHGRREHAGAADEGGHRVDRGCSCGGRCAVGRGDGRCESCG